MVFFQNGFKCFIAETQSGRKYKELFIETNLPLSGLMRIWYAYLISFAAFTEPCRLLSDTRNSGQKFFPEFVLAVYLCPWRLTGNALPLVLPEHLANKVSCLVDVMMQVPPLKDPLHM